MELLPPKISFRTRKFRHAPPGTSPGAINIPEGALKPVVRAFVYNADIFEEKILPDASSVKAWVDGTPGMMHWIDIQGLGDKIFFEQLADEFHIHRLQMEDVINVYQRPKADEGTESLFLVSRMITQPDGLLVNNQLSIFIGKNYVISISDQYEDILGPVRERVRLGKGFIRKNGSDYLGYALTDIAIDNFFPILEKTGDRLDQIENELIDFPSREAMNNILRIKRELIIMRRAIWAERDKINDILRSDFSVIANSTKIYFRDSYDHCIQILDLVESYKEVTASLMDVYMSSVSNRLNQVMKVLTIISTIFIPLTFIVGVYGMNFAHRNPDNNAVLPMNMPELYSPYGYIGVWVIMAIIVVLQVIFYYRKGWLTR